MNVYEKVRLSDIVKQVENKHPYSELDCSTYWLLETLSMIVSKLKELEERLEELEMEVLE